ncbi:sensor histidine kinase [Shimia sp.]|uniref:HAMP domain-containing sensor histidine kinase n=1 Tax=Shimia sp. TaxID=1954381 RepID=UPI003299EAB0
MTDQNVSIPNLIDARARLFGGFLAKAQRLDGRWRFVPTLQGLIFSMMMLVAVVPIAGFYTWIEQNTFRREMDSVHESHLLIARNLSAALSRYATDAKTVFGLAVKNTQLLGESREFGQALSNLHICHIVLLDSHGSELARLSGQVSHTEELPDPALLSELRQFAEQANGEIAITGIRSHEGVPHFFIVQALENAQLAVAPLSPDYVIALQKSITFGERGHSMMVDQDGLVVAHPNAEWQRISKDASKLSVVRAMMQGETGVMEFYSPPMQADMIAGYTFVPETGWGVMVPQPISELADRANESRSAAILVAFVQLAMAGLLSWWLSSWLVRPIRSIATAAGQLSQGDLDTRIGELPNLTPHEIVQTAHAFDAMGDGIEKMTDRLQIALEEAERVSHERAQLLEAAQKANQVKSQFVSMVSHELRTPLTSIKGALELMDSKVVSDDLPPEAKPLLEIALRNGRRLAVLIDDLLDLEKLDAGKLSFSFEPVELGALVTEAVEANAGYATLAGVSFNCDTSEQAITISADSSRLLQVMANLLSNAAKFSRIGDEVNVSVIADQGKAEIRVHDNGLGIPEGTGDSIFDAFTQLDSSDRRVVGGSGLGLNIARTIVARHQGTLTYESTKGAGTVFLVTLPLQSM